MQKLGALVCTACIATTTLMDLLASIVSSLVFTIHIHVDVNKSAWMHQSCKSTWVAMIKELFDKAIYYKNKKH